MRKHVDNLQYRTIGLHTSICLAIFVSSSAAISSVCSREKWSDQVPWSMLARVLCYRLSRDAQRFHEWHYAYGALLGEREAWVQGVHTWLRAEWSGDDVKTKPVLGCYSLRLCLIASRVQGAAGEPCLCSTAPFTTLPCSWHSEPGTGGRGGVGVGWWWWGVGGGRSGVPSTASGHEQRVVTQCT